MPPSSSGRDGRSASVPGWLLAATALGLFLLWSNSFIAISYLLGADGAPARFDWVGLTVARFTPIALPSLRVAFLAAVA